MDWLASVHYNTSKITLEYIVDTLITAVSNKGVLPGCRESYAYVIMAGKLGSHDSFVNSYTNMMSSVWEGGGGGEGAV